MPAMVIYISPISPCSTKRRSFFDCIEFNENFRMIDVMADVGFLIMDLYHKGATNLAQHFLNVYLEHSGDYLGLSILPYYISYRAMVRAKIQLFALEAPQLTAAEKSAALQNYRSYANLAFSLISRPQPLLIITYGASGVGKSTVVNTLLSKHPQLIAIRSDIERKRLFPEQQTTENQSTVNTGRYSQQASLKTYQHLAMLATHILQAGYSVIVDACFLKQDMRDLFFAIQQREHIPLVILECVAEKETMQAAITARQKQQGNISEATLEVLNSQLATAQPLTAQEHSHSVLIHGQATT